MLLRRGVGVVGGGVVPAVPDPSTVDYSLPWQCGWLPGYSWLHPEICPSSAVQKAMQVQPPVAPVIPAGSLNRAQNPAGPAGGGEYDVGQVINDTAVAQRQQTQDFFANLAGQLGLKDPSADPTDAAFPWSLVALAALLGGTIFLMGSRRRR